MKKEAALSEDSIIEEEAAEWVARRMGNSHFDQAKFDRWVEGDPQRSFLFDTMWERIMGGALSNALTTYDTQQRVRQRRLMAAGAAAVTLGIGGYFGLPAAQLFLTTPQVYSAQGGAMRVVHLADGTEIDLAPGSEIRVRYTGHDRDVDLRRGTLFARVARDRDRPLRVQAGEAQVTVLGTRFEVARQRTSVRVAVQSGHVTFGETRWFARPVSLIANQSATLSDHELSRGTNVQSAHIARWRDEWVDYRGATLAEVVADLQSLSNRPIQVVSKGLGERRVSGRIRLADPLHQLENLSIVHGFTVRSGPDVITISPR